MTLKPECKQDFNAQAKASMRDRLRSKPWVEKVKSIERMNLADRIAKEAMKKKLAEQSPQTGHLGE